MNKHWIAMVSAVLVSACSQMLLKKAASKKYDSFIREYLNVWVICGYGLMVVSTLLVIFAYRGIDYKNGAVIESIGYPLIMVLSNLLYKEKITKYKLIGNILVIIGIVVFYW